MPSPFFKKSLHQGLKKVSALKDFHIFKKKRRRKPKGGVLALDIGTDWVKALVCSVDYEQQKVHVKGVGRQRQRLGDMFGGGIIDIESVHQNVELAVRDAEIEAGITSNQVIVGMAGELIKGATVTVEYHREQPHEKISLPELRHMVQKVQWKAFERIRKELSWETGYAEIDVKLVHTALVDVRIDGYRVSNPIGFKGKYIHVSIFNAFAPLIHYDALRSVVEKMDKELLSIIVEPYAVSRACNFEEGGDMSSLFIDIGGGTTDVALVQNGGILGTKMYGIGGRVFTKRIAKHLNQSFLKAEELKLDYSARKLKAKTFKDVEKLVKQDVATWLEGLKIAISEFEHVDMMPSKVLLSGGGSLLPEISWALTSEPWHVGLPFARKPDVSFLCPQDVIRVVDHTKRLKNQQDITPMGLANLSLELSGETTVVSKILRQVTRLVST